MRSLGGVRTRSAPRLERGLELRAPPRIALVARPAWAALAALAMAGSPAPAGAQDFACPAPACPAGAPLAALETGVIAGARGFAIQGATLTRSGLPELTTRAAGVAVAAHGACGAAGLSQTGDPELGWTAVALALGGASRATGATVRAVARRDRHPRPADGPLGPGVGAEAGAAAWARAGGGLTLWAAAPQLWMRGAAPPLARALELGGRWSGGDLGAWLVSRTPPRGALAAEHEAGLTLALGPCRAWARARDGPARGAVGIEVCAGGVGLAAEVESHPVLGETAMLALTLPVSTAPP